MVVDVDSSSSVVVTSDDVVDANSTLPEDKMTLVVTSLIEVEVVSVLNVSNVDKNSGVDISSTADVVPSLTVVGIGVEVVATLSVVVVDDAIEFVIDVNSTA